MLFGAPANGKVDNKSFVNAFGFVPYDDRCAPINLPAPVSARLPFKPKLSPVDFRASAGGSIAVSGSEDDLSYGIGMEFDISDRSQFTVEYISYITNDNFDFSGISLGVVYEF